MWVRILHARTRVCGVAFGMVLGGVPGFVTFFGDVFCQVTRFVTPLFTGQTFSIFAVLLFSTVRGAVRLYSTLNVRVVALNSCAVAGTERLNSTH